MKFKNIQEHFGRRILYFLKNIIAHKNSLQVFNRFNDIYFSIIFQFLFNFCNNNITGFKNVKNIQEHSVQIQEHSRTFSTNSRTFKGTRMKSRVSKYTHSAASKASVKLNRRAFGFSLSNWNVVGKKWWMSAQNAMPSFQLLEKFVTDTFCDADDRTIDTVTTRLDVRRTTSNGPTAV